LSFWFSAAAASRIRALMIILRDIGLRRGSKLLLHDANVTIQPGQRLALIGANGSGKSSLFSLLLGTLAADTGEIQGMGKLRLAHMAQEVQASAMPAQEYVWRGDSRLAQLRDELLRLEAADDFDGAARIHGELEEIDGYSAERRAARLLQGLGFTEDAPTRPVNDFSGGWRIRLNLARALMTPSDVLLLDEPTNHLDLDATLWLQQWLQQYPGTLLMISHDRDFIDGTCERILQIEHQQLHAYKGNYSDFERQRAERLANQQASYEKQQRRIAEIDDFVRRFRYKATKAKQAQSRLKELERIQTLAPAHLDSPFDFHFLPPEKTSDPLLRLDGAALGYDDQAILSAVELHLRPGTRFGLLGKNGAGKSTLLKSLIGRLPLLAGERAAGEHCRIGYFDQQQLEVLDLEASAAAHLQRLSPEAREQDILNFLGGFNFRGDSATSPVAPFSGGEKARLALAMVVWQRPNLLVLDEPTNHLDLDMRHAMEVALQAYEGALILVSHDRHMLRNTVDELLLVHDGQVEAYTEDLEGYERWILSSYRQAEQPAAAVADTSRKDKRQQAAAQREKLRPLKKKIDQTEAEMARVEAELALAQTRLADSELYDPGRKGELAALLQREGELKTSSQQLEESWFEQQQALEELDLS
jgi:ATP-binding cassette, subfamily F, member 3